MGPCLFLPEHLFRLSHCKTHWTMSTNNACLKTRILETYNSMVTLTSFFLGVNQSGPRDKVTGQSQI